MVARLAPGFTVRALVVDDIPENREILAMMLGMIGCEVVLAENGRQALEVVRVSRPQIVFLDMRLPDMDGVEITRRIVAEPAAWGLKVVATSASALAHQRDLYLRSGCDDFIAKPFQAERIYASLENLLEVEFEYASPGSRDGNADCDKDDPVSAAASMGATACDFTSIILPEALATRLMMAAELHSATVLKNCLADVEKLGPTGARLASHLRGFLKCYDMATIQRLVAQIAVEPAPAAPAGSSFHDAEARKTESAAAKDAEPAALTPT